MRANDIIIVLSYLHTQPHPVNGLPVSLSANSSAAALDYPSETGTPRARRAAIV
jgi:hypothetical protein